MLGSGITTTACTQQLPGKLAHCAAQNDCKRRPQAGVAHGSSVQGMRCMRKG